MLKWATLSTYLAKRFELALYKTTVRNELIAGASTFFTMVYIIFVNPMILAKSGMPATAVFTATCLVVIVACLLVGLLANYPIAIAPSMGLNMYFSYVVVLTFGYSWQTALGAVFISGVLFFLLTLSGIRRLMIEAMPPCISTATAVGIGLFIGMIALQNAGIIVGDPRTLLKLGPLLNVPVLLTLVGFFMIVMFEYYQITGAVVISIFAISMIALVLGYTHFYGVVALPPSLSPTFLHLAIPSLFNKHSIMIIFTFVLVAFFDGVGTLMGVLRHVEPLRPDRQACKRRLKRTLISDSVATILAGLLGTSNTTVYIESAAGIRVGGRTGLTAITVAILFIIALFFSPLVKMMPSFASTPALLFIACMMLKHMGDIQWHDLTQAIPAAVTMIMIPFSFSIADGIGLGIISYVIIQLLCGKIKTVKPMLIVLALLFMVYFF